MTIPATEFREDYQGNGSVAAYDYSWRIYDESELAVYQLDNDGNETKLVLNQDYTVSGVRLVSGGQVTLSVNLPSGYRLTIIPDVPVEQQTDFRNQGRFFPETHEEQFDKLTVISKQQGEAISRCIKMSAVVSPADFNPEVPAGIVGEANVLLMTDATGTRFIKGPTRPEIEGFVQEATEQANRAEEEADRAEQFAIDNESALKDTGWFPVSGSFENGGSITEYNQVLLLQNADGSNGAGYYSWAGELPKTVAENSKPSTTGGLGKTAWVYRADATLRSGLSNAESEVVVAGVQAKSIPKYRNGSKNIITSAIIRQPTAGGGWQFIDDLNHRTVGYSSVSVNASEPLELDVNFDFSLSKIGSVQVTPDETFARDIRVGHSAKTDRVALRFYQDMTILVNNEAVSGGLIGNTYHDETELSFTKNADETITVSHPLLGVTGWDQNAVVTAYNSKQQGVYVREGSTIGQVTYGLYRPLSGRIRTTDAGASWDVITNALYKPTASFSGGVLTVTIPPLGVLGDLIPGFSATLYGTTNSPFSMKANSVLENQFEIRFFEQDGTQVTTGNNNMDFTFVCGGAFVKQEMGEGQVQISLRNVILRPENIKNDSGNFWINATFEEQ